MKLKGIPLELFTKNGIGYIASVLGVPLHMDRVTAAKKRLEYARVCVELDVGREIPRFIEVVRKSGCIAEVEVIIPWMPVKCAECKVLGHSSKVCSQKNSQEVKPKAVPKPYKVWTVKSMAVEGKDFVETDSIVDTLNVQVKEKMVVVAQSPEKNEDEQVHSSIEKKTALEIEVGDCSAISGGNKKSSASKKKKSQGKGGSLNRFELIEDDVQVSRLLDELDLAVYTRKPRLAA